MLPERGEVAERLKAAVLKTVDRRRSGGSNPPLSATRITQQTEIEQFYLISRGCRTPRNAPVRSGPVGLSRGTLTSMDGDSLTLIVAIAALMVGLWRLIARDINAVRADLRDIRTEAAADRRALQVAMDSFRSEMLRLAERQARVEGRLDGRGSAAD